MKLIVIPFVLLVVGGWLSAAIHGFVVLNHLSGRLTRGEMLVRGIEWLNPDNFTEQGQLLRRRMGQSMLAFFFGLVLLAVVSVIVG
jgi:hypothetical protein